MCHTGIATYGLDLRLSTSADTAEIADREGEFRDYPQTMNTQYIV